MGIGWCGEGRSGVVHDVCGKGDERWEVIPESMAGQLSLHESPDSFDEVELGTVRGKPEQHDLGCIAHQPMPEGHRLVIGGIVHDQHQWLGGPPLDQRRNKFPKGSRGRAIMDRRDQRSRGVIECPENGDSLIDAGGENSLW